MMDDRAAFFAEQNPDTGALLVLSLFPIAVAVAALVAAFRLLLASAEHVRTGCARWAMIATATSVALYCCAPEVGWQVPLLVSIAALDCWLVLWSRPRSIFPRARLRSRRWPRLRRST